MNDYLTVVFFCLMGFVAGYGAGFLHAVIVATIANRKNDNDLS